MNIPKQILLGIVLIVISACVSNVLSEAVGGIITPEGPMTRGRIVNDQENARPLDYSIETPVADKETSPNSAVRIYLAMPPQGYISGVPSGETLTIRICIESPSEWQNTLSGIIGWEVSVKVDPNVLEPLTVNNVPERTATFSEDGFLHDFIIRYEYSDHQIMGVLYAVNKTEGEFWDIAQFISCWRDMPGAGGSGELCELKFESKSQTAYTTIDLHEAYYWTPDGRREPIDLVDDGHYNRPSKS